MFPRSRGNPNYGQKITIPDGEIPIPDGEISIPGGEISFPDGTHSFPDEAFLGRLLSVELRFFLRFLIAALCFLAFFVRFLSFSCTLCFFFLICSAFRCRQFAVKRQMVRFFRCFTRFLCTDLCKNISQFEAVFTMRVYDANGDVVKQGWVVFYSAGATPPSESPVEIISAISSKSLRIDAVVGAFYNLSGSASTRCRRASTLLAARRFL